MKARLGLAVVLAGMVVACGGKNVAPQNTGQPDRFLMDRGNEAIAERDSQREMDRALGRQRKGMDRS